MLMCSRCKKRPAVVFISQMNAKDPQHKKNEGLCLVCAKELGISQVDDYMKAMGISDDDLEAMSNQLMEASDGDDFEPGGTNFLSNLFGGDAANLFSNLAGGMPKATDEGGENKPKDKKKKLKFLNNYCTNLTQKAREGKLDNVVGRDKEISRVIHILSRRQKNNPCLIGEPGVGKTAIAEGIAQRIVAGDVPFHIKDKELYLLDLTALVAGTQFRGQFESRCKGLVEEVKEQGNVILFIDEVHTLVGTGDNEGTMNAANILKPSLSRGEIQVIGATTFKEYRNRVVERFGAEVDKELRYNIKAKKFEETVTDPDSGKEKKVKSTVDVAAPSTNDYARFFDDTCEAYESNMDYNLMYLRSQQNLANDKLKANGYLFLSDVYDQLGIKRTKMSQIVGWVYKPEGNENGDNFVDFGILETNRETEDGGYEKAILMEFNVDGPILDLI